jgi:hypothetical protein
MEEVLRKASSVVSLDRERAVANEENRRETRKEKRGVQDDNRFKRFEKKAIARTAILAKHPNPVKSWALLYAWVYLFVVMTVLFVTLGSIVWTNNYLTQGDVPYYSTVKPWTAERWNADHIMLMLSIPMYLIPLALQFTFIAKPTESSFFLNVIVSGVIAFIWLANWIYLCVKWGQCDQWAMCVNEDPFGNPGAPNNWWYAIYFGNLVMVVMIGGLIGNACMLYRATAMKRIKSRVAAGDMYHESIKSNVL